MNYFIVCLFIIITDQVSKIWIVKNFRLYESRTIIPDFFNLVYVTNKGAAFSMFANVNSPWRHYFFAALGIFACVALTVMSFKLSKENKLYGVSLGLIAGGAAGNLIDRFRLGAVVDFLDFFIGSYHWPAFNVADSGICVGVVLFFILNLQTNKHKGSI